MTPPQAGGPARVVARVPGLGYQLAAGPRGVWVATAAPELRHVVAA